MRVDFVCSGCERRVAEAYPVGEGSGHVIAVRVGRWELYLLGDWNAQNLIPRDGMYVGFEFDCHPKRCGRHYPMRPATLTRRLAHAARSGSRTVWLS